MDQIDDRKRGGCSLSESSLDIDLNSFPDAVVVADPDTGQIVEANTIAGKLFHCDSSELIGCQHWELHPEAEKDNYKEAFERAVDGQRVNRLENGQPQYIETVDGQRVPVEINAKQLNTPDGVLLLGVFREVTNHLDRERRLETITTRLETLLNALPIPVTVLDSDGTIERWNQAAETTFGYSADSVVGKQYPLFIKEQEFEQVLERILDGSVLDGYETAHRTDEGERVPVELYARPLYENNSFTGVIGAAIDLSDRKQQESQLDVLYRVLRHNLRNELTVIGGWTEELAAGDSQQQQAIEQIERATDRLLSLSEEANRIRTGLTEDVHQHGSIPVTKAVSLLSDQVTEQGIASMRVVEQPASGTICYRGSRAVSQLFDSVVYHIGDEMLELAVETHYRHVVLEITAPVPVLAEGVQSFINTGREKSLGHGTDLAIPNAVLMIESIGGDVTIRSDTETTAGTTLSIELPRMDIGDNSSLDQNGRSRN